MMSPKDPFPNIALVCLAAVAVFLFSSIVKADVEGAVGIQQSLYTDGSSNEWSFGGKLGHTSTPVYLWGLYEGPTAKILGQPMGDMDLFSVGVGTSLKVSRAVRVFIETGYVFTDIELNDNVVDEVNYTWLVSRHDAGGNRNVPVPCAYNPGCYDYQYSVDDGVVARVGVRWELSPNVAVTGSYKFTYLDQEMTIKRPEFEDGQGYWREDETLDLSAFEVGVWYTW